MCMYEGVLYECVCVQVSCVTDLQSKNCPYSEFDFVGMAVCIKTAL